MMRRFAAAFLCCVGLAACTPQHMMSPESLMNQDARVLCDAHHQKPSASIKNELIRRNALSEKEWASVSKKQIYIGMSELALLCAWGSPGGWGAVNRSTGTWGTSAQYVYRVCRSCGANYVYVRNGAVSGWSD